MTDDCSNTMNRVVKVKTLILAMLLIRLGFTSKQLTANFMFIQVDKMSKDVGWLMEQPVRSACQTGV